MTAGSRKATSEDYLLDEPSENSKSDNGATVRGRGLPGLWLSLYGLALSPLRLLRWCVRHYVITFGALLVVAVVFVGWPIATSGTRDADKAEGEQMMGSFKNQVRIMYAKTHVVPHMLTGEYDDRGCAMPAAELQGKCFVSDPRIEYLPDGRARQRRTLRVPVSCRPR